MNRTITWAATAALALSPLALAASSTAAPSVHAKAAKTYSVTAKVNTDVAIAKEDTVKVKGRVTPKAKGQKVILQQRVGNKKKWTVTGSAKIKKNGTYKLTDKPTTPGSREYRVLKPGSNGIKKGFSKPVQVEVYRWENLAYRTAGPNTNITPGGVNIGAQFYGASLFTSTANTASTIEYTLGRKCIQLRATYALTDESATGATGAVTVSADGTVVANKALAVGTIFADETVDITDAFRLKIDATATAPATAPTAATAAVATPEVLCTR
ncbi:NPCBM/NEW2 domain-containing protein [Nocardioides okcheonensis]|uniref:NPCBM/NEW2 domain-containing protein n=1 Tax=Nocardioides okcheonensis TaxID=2894081 RepID=UPI001E5B29EA|nr:NPCBM/NEW2 domain-containing protein [Nocardioides okcheonensis]UFN46059.1 hypothetical protein LN652_07620 [Nocardioides okcheonensis]